MSAERPLPEPAAGVPGQPEGEIGSPFLDAVATNDFTSLVHEVPETVRGFPTPLYRGEPPTHSAIADSSNVFIAYWGKKKDPKPEEKPEESSTRDHSGEKNPNAGKSHPPRVPLREKERNLFEDYGIKYDKKGKRK